MQGNANSPVATFMLARYLSPNRMTRPIRVTTWVTKVCVGGGHPGAARWDRVSEEGETRQGTANSRVAPTTKTQHTPSERIDRLERDNTADSAESWRPHEKRQAVHSDKSPVAAHIYFKTTYSRQQTNPTTGVTRWYKKITEGKNRRIHDASNLCFLEP